MAPLLKYSEYWVLCLFQLNSKQRPESHTQASVCVTNVSVIFFVFPCILAQLKITITLSKIISSHMLLTFLCHLKSCNASKKLSYLCPFDYLVSSMKRLAVCPNVMTLLPKRNIFPWIVPFSFTFIFGTVFGPLVNI